MTLFLLKLTLTPLMMYAVTAAGRRWGPGLSGWLTGLPLLAGPVSAFVCLEQGQAFAAHAAGTTLLGMWSSCAFSVAYVAVARRTRGWPWPSLAAVGAFLVGTAALTRLEVSPWLGFAGALLGAWLCRRHILAPAAASTAPSPPRWDLPARMTIAAGFVVVQTAAAGWLGQQLSGLLTPFPIVVILLTAFAHHQLGIDGATRVLRGFLVGMYAFATFFLVVALGLEPLGPFTAYALALTACIVVNGATLASLRRGL